MNTAPTTHPSAHSVRSSSGRKLLCTGAALAAMLSATPAMALVSGQAQVGKRWAEIEPNGGGDKTGAQATELVAAVHVDPIPLVPVSAGLSLALQTWNADDFQAKTAAGSELGLEVMAWVPMVPFVTPYAKLRYVLMGKLLVEGETTSDVGGQSVTTKYAVQNKTSGIHVNLGAKLSLLPLVSVLVEVGNSFGEVEMEELKVGGTKQTLSDDDKKADKLSSRAFLVGVEVGI